MAAQAQLADRIISLLYDGVLTPPCWTEALSLLCVLMGCDQAALTTWDRSTNLAGISESVGLPIECRQQFVDHYCTLDPARNVMDLIPAGGWYVDHEMVGRTQMRRSAFYQDFLRSFELASIVASPLLRDSCLECFLVFQYGHAAARHTQRFPVVMNGVVPHIQRAVRLRQRFAHVEEVATRSITILKNLTFPILIVDANGRVISATAAAEGLLARSAHLTIRQDQMMCGGTAGRRLQLLFREACGAPPCGGGIVIGEGDAQAMMQLLVTPLPPNTAMSEASSRPLAMVLLHDLNGRTPSHEGLCQQMFSLTPAEARVAIGITRGLTPKDLAQQAGVSVSTVRTQLSNVLQKTGSSRQADLARVLGGLLLLR